MSAIDTIFFLLIQGIQKLIANINSFINDEYRGMITAVLAIIVIYMWYRVTRTALKFLMKVMRKVIFIVLVFTIGIYLLNCIFKGTGQANNEFNNWWTKLRVQDLYENLGLTRRLMNEDPLFKDLNQLIHKEMEILFDQIFG